MPPLLAGELTTAQMGGQGSPHRDNFVSGKILLLIMKMFAAHATPFEQQDPPSPFPNRFSTVYRNNLGFLTSKNSVDSIVLPTIFAASIVSPQ